MIGLDTNILLRLLLADDREQTARATALLSAQSKPAILSDVVLAETCWVLRSRFGAAPDVIEGMIERLLNNRAFEPENRPVVERALAECRAHGVGFPDALIGARNAAAGCETTYTFDQRATRSPLFRLAP